jgi:hypothetical protein
VCIQDERLAQFVVSSHVRHHPNAGADAENNNQVIIIITIGEGHYTVP